MIEGQLGFGALLRRYRMRAGLTQAALAAEAGLSLRGISDLERGLRRVPYPATVKRLVATLGLGMAEQAALRAAKRTRPDALRRTPHRLTICRPASTASSDENLKWGG